MEKITKEGLLEQLNLASLSDEDLANVSGGAGYDAEMVIKKCIKNCLEKGFTNQECNAKCLK